MDKVDQPRTVKAATCKYCNSSDVFWEKTPDGKWYLSDMQGGLPHLCAEADAAYEKRNQEKKQQWIDHNNKLKQKYQEEKDKLSQTPDNSPCTHCAGGYINSFNPQKCYICSGSGKLTKAAKSRILYRLRKQLWPNFAKPRR